MTSSPISQSILAVKAPRLWYTIYI